MRFLRVTVVTLIIGLSGIATAAPIGARGCPPITVSPPSGTKLPNGTVGVPYSTQITASGTPTYFWQMTEGRIPFGLDWNPKGSGGSVMTIDGTPTAAGIYSGSWVVYEDGSGQCLGTPANYTIEIVSEEADVFVQKSASPDPVTVGQPLTYTITVANGGPGIAKGVTVSDALAPGVEMQSVSSTVGSCTATGTVLCQLGDLDPQQGATITVVTSVDAPGTITNTAEISTTSPDPVTSNNSATREVTVVASDDVANLSVKKTGPAQVREGATFSYDLIVRNAGPDPAPAVVVDDGWDATLATFESAAGCTYGSSLKCQLGTIEPGGERLLTVTLKASKPGKLVNTATVSSAASDPQPGNNVSPATTKIQGLKLIGLEITQGIQNLRNQVGLIQGRDTYVLAHVRSTTNDELEDVSGTLEVRTASGTTTLTAGPITAPEKGFDFRLRGFLLFKLPVSAFAAAGAIDVEFRPTVGTVVCRDPSGVADDCISSGTFTPAPTIEVVLVEVTWGPASDRHSPGGGDFQRVLDQVYSVIPTPFIGTSSYVSTQRIRIERPPTDIGDFERLNGRLARVRTDDLCGSDCKVFYLGVLVDKPTRDAVNGLALDIPSFAASGYLVSTEKKVLPHELAHAIGLKHTKCEDEAGVDRNYPYPDGTISKERSGPDAFYGFNIVTAKTLGPKSLDLMCDNAQWPSDYTWQKMRNRLSKVYGTP